MENVYLYGPTGGKVLTEDLPYAATTRKGSTRASMAQALLEAHHQGRVRVAIGRASDFFGPGVLDSAAGERVFGPALSGKAVQVLGNPDLAHTYTYIPDIGKGLVIRTGLPAWSRRLDSDGNVDTVTRRAWSLLSR